MTFPSRTLPLLRVLDSLPMLQEQLHLLVLFLFHRHSDQAVLFYVLTFPILRLAVRCPLLKGQLVQHRHLAVTVLEPRPSVGIDAARRIQR
jgi:hypothetical protein